MALVEVDDLEHPAPRQLDERRDEALVHRVLDLGQGRLEEVGRRFLLQPQVEDLRDARIRQRATHRRWRGARREVLGGEYGR